MLSVPLDGEWCDCGGGGDEVEPPWPAAYWSWEEGRPLQLPIFTSQNGVK